MGNGEGPTGASTQKRTERPLPHVLSHLHLQAIHLKLIPVFLLYPVDFFKQLLDTSLTLRARHLAVGHGFSHLAILGNRPSIHVGAQCLWYQVLFDSLIDALPPFPLTWPKDIRAKFGGSFGIITLALSTLRHVIIELSASRDNFPGAGDIF
jgi:hypothetical protein